jgi:hypothetical protein
LGTSVASRQAALPTAPAQAPVTNRTSFAVRSYATDVEVAIEISGPSPAEVPILRIEGETRQEGSRLVAVTPFTLVVEAGPTYRLSLSSDTGDFVVEQPGGRRGVGRRFDIGRQLCLNQVDTCMMYLANQWTAAR